MGFPIMGAPAMEPVIIGMGAPGPMEPVIMGMGAPIGIAPL